jgi:hypothetical protein
MQFNDKDAGAFWPVYKMFDAEQTRVDDERMQLVKSYADNWTPFTDAEVRDLVQKSLALESCRIDLRNKYFDRCNCPGSRLRNSFNWSTACTCSST